MYFVFVVGIFGYYIVVMKLDFFVSYEGDVKGFKVIKLVEGEQFEMQLQDLQWYFKYFENEQIDFVSDIGVIFDMMYQVVFNGFSVDFMGEQVDVF